MIEIEHGCTKVMGTEGTYRYTVKKVGSDKLLDSETESYVFEVVDTMGDPRIGDFIKGTQLVRRTELKVNPDWRKWKDKDLYGNP